MKPTLFLVMCRDSRHHFCGKFSHSQILLYNLSHCFCIHIQFFCYYSIVAPCISELHVTVSSVQNIECCLKMFLYPI